MNNHMSKISSTGLIVFLGIALSPGISRAEEASVAGIYLLTEMNGQQLPANAWAENTDGKRCKQVILEGSLLLDSEGRSAAFITERLVCPNEDGSGTAGKEHSVMFVGSYTVSADQILIEDDFGQDRAVVEGDVLVYETGGEGRPIERFIFTKE